MKIVSEFLNDWKLVCSTAWEYPKARHVGLDKNDLLMEVGMWEVTPSKSVISQMAFRVQYRAGA